jgi:hypothetical protein
LFDPPEAVEISGRSSPRYRQVIMERQTCRKRRVLYAAAPEDFSPLRKIPEPPFDAAKRRGIWLSDSGKGKGLANFPRGIDCASRSQAALRNFRSSQLIH